MELTIKHTPVFEKNFDTYQDDSIRFIINQGGSRSSKTWSIIQLVIVIALQKPRTIISIIRKSGPTLRATAMKDFFDVLKELNLYEQFRHHKTSNYYEFYNGSIVEFFSADDQQKLRGRRRDVLWANEANELTFEEFNQLNMRTTDKLFFDFNPSDNDHWLYELIDRDNSRLIKSTYLDNPFLSKPQMDEIAHLISVDENYYKIYALGEKPIPHTRIYTHFKKYNELPYDADDIVYGLDFGFNHPTALVKLSRLGEACYIEEIIYQSGLTSIDTVRLFGQLGVDKNKYIYADTARPEIIEEMKRAGYMVKGANKAVKEGIDYIKSKEIYLHENATNLWKEYKMYNWKTYKDTIIDEPVKLYDDGMDAIRYALYSSKKKNAPVPFVMNDGNKKRFF